jgi:glycosyltransferase involved in cell wall biosynthesis
MKISIFTPTHNPKFIERLYDSIKNQTFENWEWIIVSNNCDLSFFDPKDERIKIYSCDFKATIGFLKKYAIEKCCGEIVIEADHDDELFPEALEECFNAFKDESVDFVYSNSCDVYQDYKSRTFAEEFGWRSRPCKYKKYDLQEIISFPPDPRSISKIWYAPNHFRAWRKSFYDKIGGHNIFLEILDDQDLMCRTYINGNMKHVDKPLYIYHLHESNTCYGNMNSRIQEMTLEIHDKYIYKLVEKWCDLNNLLKIDLCGGFNKPAGYKSVDLKNSDYIFDLNEKWKLEDNSVGVFRAHDAIEHLKDPIHTMREAYRCLAPNGWFLTQTPSTDGRGAFQDPTHCSFWNSNSFWYYTKREQAQFIGTPVKFQLNRIKNFYPTEWHQTHNILYVKADLLKFDGRTPGPIEI